MQSLQSDLNNLSMIDRMNRFKVSRRLSFLLKNIDPALRHLLAIHKAKRFEDAHYALRSLQEFTRVSVNENQELDPQKASQVLQIGQDLLEKRSDYKEHMGLTVYGVSIGGELLTKRDQIIREIPLRSVPTVPSEPTDPSFEKKKYEEFMDQAWAGLVQAHPEYSFDQKLAVQDAMEELYTKGIFDDEAELVFEPSKNVKFIKAFVSRLNPIAQAQDLGEAAWNATLFLTDCYRYLDPRYQNYLMAEGRIDETLFSQIDPEKFISTLSTVNALIGGPLGLVPQEEFVQAMRPIIDKASELTAEEWGEITGNLLFPMLASKTIKAAGTVSRMAQTHPEIIEALQGLKAKFGIEGAEALEAVSAEGGVALKEFQTAENPSVLKNATDKLPGGKTTVQKVAKEQVEWASHYLKHKPPKNVSWKDIIKSTKYDAAKYKPGIDIKQLELHAWEHGQQVTTGKNWKVFKCNEVIGANSGKETCYMRVECSANVIHGHPILEKDYLRYLK